MWTGGRWGVLMFEMLAGRSPFDIVGQTDNPDQNTEDYLFQGTEIMCAELSTQSVDYVVDSIKFRDIVTQIILTGVDVHSSPSKTITTF